MGTPQELSEAVQKGDAPRAREITAALLKAGLGPAQILDEGLIAGMREVGRRFKCNEIYIPEVLVSSRAMSAGMEVLRPELVKDGARPLGTMLLGTVRGDLHDIGKNIVKMMAQGAGVQVVDLGVDVSADAFLKAARDYPRAKVIGISALLTSTMPGIGEIIRRFEKEGLRNSVKFVVGGAALTERAAREIGADAYAPDAAGAAEKIRALLR